MLTPVSRSMPALPRHQRQPVSGEPKRSANSGAVGLAGHELMPGGGGAGEVLGVDHIARRAPDEVLDGDADAPLEGRGCRRG